MQTYLEKTGMLDFEHKSIAELIRQRQWAALPLHDRIGDVYRFCKDEILFGYNRDTDDMPASAVLSENIGHCNTKATLFMSLLRALGIPCRLHAFTIHKRLQKGAIGGIAYLLAPREIIHTWVEVFYDENWVALEGLILDRKYLCSVQQRFAEAEGPFCGYAIATDNLHRPNVDWTGSDTFIQREGIVRDFGVFDSPDAFYETHGTNVAGIRKLIYRAAIHRLMNRTVRNIRNGRSHKPTYRLFERRST